MYTKKEAVDHPFLSMQSHSRSRVNFHHRLTTCPKKCNLERLFQCKANSGCPNTLFTHNSEGVATYPAVRNMHAHHASAHMLPHALLYRLSPTSHINRTVLRLVEKGVRPKGHLRNSPVTLSLFSSPAWASLADDVEKLGLEYELALLVFFRRLVGPVVLPPDNLVADATADVAHDVAAGGHVALARLGTLDVDDRIE